MSMANGFSRRHFLKTVTAATTVLGVVPSWLSAQPRAKYIRHEVNSPEGQKALDTYDKAVRAMLSLPPDNPRNWYRNAFVHLLDCPHGNWWFYVWHRAYLGFLEQNIRIVSGDPTFAFPYWDWTASPEIPQSMFSRALSPASEFFAPYIENLSVFTNYIQQPLQAYWATFSKDQKAQLNVRGYADFSNLWNDVTGFDPKTKNGISGNIAFANPSGARYLTAKNPKLDQKTAYNVSKFIIDSGLKPTDFYNASVDLSFVSAKTASHHNPPGKFSVLEGLSHNKVHNFIGGVGPLDPGPYGFMTNFLSSVDPIFYLHHANMDRLWDVWTRKQMRSNLPYLPSGADLNALSDEAFLFFVNGNGDYVGPSKAGDYLSTDRFEYSYSQGTGDLPPESSKNAQDGSPIKGTVAGNAALLSIPGALIRSHLAAETSMIAEVILPHPSVSNTGKQFDVLVGAPASVTHVEADSPYYAGTVSFFGSMAAMNGMQMNATFSVPIPRKESLFTMPLTEKSSILNIRLVPSDRPSGPVPTIRGAVVRSM
jgi:tyrosinase